jgi:hypothetical protein
VVHHGRGGVTRDADGLELLGVAVHVAFEKANFETSFSLLYRLLKAWKPGAALSSYGSTGLSLYSPTSSHTVF